MTPPAHPVYCRKCKSVMKQAHKYCPICGWDQSATSSAQTSSPAQSVATPQPVSTPTATQTLHPTLVKYAVGMMLFFFVALICIFTMSRGNGTGKRDPRYPNENYEILAHEKPEARELAQYIEMTNVKIVRVFNGERTQDAIKTRWKNNSSVPIFGVYVDIKVVDATGQLIFEYPNKYIYTAHTRDGLSAPIIPPGLEGGDSDDPDDTSCLILPDPGIQFSYPLTAYVKPVAAEDKNMRDYSNRRQIFYSGVPLHDPNPPMKAYPDGTTYEERLNRGNGN
jgi:hypothetical protein